MAQITRVLPIDTRTEPLACGATFNSKLMGRISSGARPSLRCIKEKLNAGASLRDEDLRRRKWRLLNHLVHPELRAASQQYGDVAYPIDSQLGSNAGGLFTLHGPTICRSSALLSAGVGGAMERVRFYLRLLQLDRDNYASHNVNGGLRTSF